MAITMWQLILWVWACLYSSHHPAQATDTASQATLPRRTAQVLYQPPTVGGRRGDGEFIIKYYDNQDEEEASKFWEAEAVGSIVVAKAEYIDGEARKSGFGSLRIQTNPDYPDNLQAFGAGYIEGALSAHRIYQSFLNLQCQVDCSGEVPEELSSFFRQQHSWARENARSRQDGYWQAVGTLLDQFDGLMRGYNDHADRGQRLDIWAFTLMNSAGDLFDVLPAVLKERRPDVDHMTYKELRRWMLKSSHCSAMVKVADDLSDIFVGHSTWFSYAQMIRIYKLYEFNFQNPSVVSHRMSFSSYPGTLSSLDDYYQMPDSGLAMVETTNPILNMTLYDQVKPESLLAWQRVRLANMMADTGRAWFKVLARENSGTYNNQYMLVDYKLFRPGSALPPDTLWVVEQIPGLVRGADVTEHLERSHWPSYNVPFFPEIYQLSGLPLLDKLLGKLPGTMYELDPRAKIFRRDHGLARDLTGFMQVLRSNDYQTDPFSEQDPNNAVCARGDLADPPVDNACYDTKVMSYSLFWKSQSWVINGPTTQGQPAFSWSNSSLAASIPHFGQPDTFDFRFELMDLTAPTP